MRKHYFGIFLFLLIITFNNSFSQVVINEISAANYSEIKGPDGEFKDWIELYNAGSTVVDLTGYSITDDQNDPSKFTFQSGKIQPGDYQLIYASNNNFPFKVHHWELAIDEDNDWRYYSSSAQPDTNWRNLSFNETVWQRAPGGFGFGDGDDNTTIPTTKAVFLRRTFTVSDPNEILSAILNVDYDDGFIAYLNGVEIARANMGSPGTRPGNNVLAKSSHEAKMYNGGHPDYFYLNPKQLHDLLRTGNNVLAIQVHNESATNTDLSSRAWLTFGMKNSGSTYANVHSWFENTEYEVYESNFKLDRHGETIWLYNSNGVLADQQSFSYMQEDNSAGRKPDGGGWGAFKVSSPGSTNNNSTLYTGVCPPPVFDHDAGFFTSNFTLNISSPLSGGTIRYTTDGSDPTTSSSQWNNGMSISGTKVVKARIFKSNYIGGEIVTHTFIKNQSYNLPVVTINTDPDNLFNNNTGIYELGNNADASYPYFGANFWQDWEKPATVEYFDRNDDPLFDVYADIKIYGNYSRAKPQKSFEIKVNNFIGGGDIDYPLIPDKPTLPKFKNFILRNSGSEWNITQFRDAYLERVMKNTHSGYLAAQPVNVFINGSYWGIYQLSENHDHHFIENNYGYKEDEIDYLIEGGSIDTKLGSKDDFMSMVNYATGTSASSSTYYDKINSMLDLDNFTDYMIAETYYDNEDWMGDWTNNIKIWRPAGGKWKYLMYDLDMTVGYSGSVTTNTLKVARDPNNQNYTSDLFDAVLENPTYKNYFINRYADLINTIFRSDSMKVIEKQFKDSMASDMVKHFAKWGGSTSSWNSSISSIESWVSSRPSKMRGFIQSEFHMNSQVTLTLNVSPAGAGKILISTVTPKSYPWSGVYFNGNPVTITAIANPGYTFNHWHSNVAFTTNNTNISVNRNFTSSDQITAYFSGTSAAPSLVVSEFNYNSSPLHDAGDWIELHNYSATPIDLSGWVLKDNDNTHAYTFPVTTIIPPNGYLVVAQNMTSFATEHSGVSNVVGPSVFSFSSSGDQIRLFDSNGFLILDMTYDDHSPWPSEADGNGYTCELLSITGSLSDGNNWFAGCIGGTPGRAYSAPNTNVTVPGNTSVCTGDTVHLAASQHSGYAYQWALDGTMLNGETSSGIEAVASGNYTVLVTDQGCTLESSPVTVTVNPLTLAPVVQDVNVCDSGSVTLNATSNETINWYEDQSTPNVLATGSSFITPFINQNTTYFVNAGGNCPSVRVPVNVIMNSSPVISLGNDTILNSGEVLLLDAGNGYTSYLWSDGSTTQSAQGVSPVVMWVVVTDSLGCTGTDTLSITSPVSVSELMRDGVSVYPNPAHGRINFMIDMGADEQMDINLYDSQGKSVYRSSVHGHGMIRGELNLQTYAQGIYVLSFTTQHDIKRVTLKIEQ
jgi:hypothetical protein